MTEDEERAEAVIRAGVAVPAKDWTCVGCLEVVTIREPGRPAGVHGTVVKVDEAGKPGKPVDVWAHAKPRCISGILRTIGGEEVGEPESAPTPIRPRREGKPAEIPEAVVKEAAASN
jgi:hypothetical protein